MICCDECTSTLGSAIRSAMGLKIAMKEIDDPLTRPGGFGFVNEPIAELFLGTSVMFSDIVGKCSSTSLAVTLSIYLFLVAIFLTVNISVFIILRTQDSRSGVPNGPQTSVPPPRADLLGVRRHRGASRHPVPDHAAAMARFAFEARDAVRDVRVRLDEEPVRAVW